MEKQAPIVSVIIPCYNGSKYIEKSITSVLNQGVSLEIIFINDFSNDNTDDIINDFIQKYDNIKYVKNECSYGVAKSRNKGVSLAKGKYIAFLDVDDIWNEGKLKKQIDLMERTKCVLSYTARELIQDDGEKTGRILPVFEKVNYKQLLKTNSIPCSSVLLLKEVAVEFPMKKDNLHEDYLTWLQILKKYNVAYGINEPLLQYRLTPNGKSRGKIKSSIMTYRVHRELKANVFKATYYTLQHLISGIKKYSKSYFNENN